MLKNSLPLFSKVGMFIFFLLLCFIPIRKVVSNYYWGYDNDNYRDMSNVNNLVEGNLSEDPTYLGEFRWYNPLLHWTEALIVEVTGIPVNQVISQAGPYLNILGAVCFFLMVLVMFDFSISICASAGFLFFTSNDIPGYFSATYTPWLFPVTYMQFVFYLGIIALLFTYRHTQFKWFVLSGFIIGLTFLGHTGPAIILILQMGVLTTILLAKIIKKESELKLAYLVKCVLAAAICFLIISLPFTYIVLGKYHLKLINQATYEYAEPMFQLRNLLYLIKINFSASLLISIFGMFYLLKSKVPQLIKNIVFSWFVISFFLYAYVTISKFIRYHYGYSFPGIVPSFHFFFYLKAVQSVFFGIGFVALIRLIIEFVNDKYKKFKLATGQIDTVIAFVIALVVIINYPGYLKRGDFKCGPEQINDDYHIDQIKVYQWLIKNTNINQVVLCEEDQITFPLLPSGRKMVVCSIDHTNPYVEYFKRKDDRDLMLQMLKGKLPANTTLFNKYHVQYVLAKNSINYPNLVKFFPIHIFSSKTFSVYTATGHEDAAKNVLEFIRQHKRLRAC